MIKVLFVCHGNICRSPTAEFYMKDLIHREGLEKEFEIASAATSTEELGNPVYPPAQRILEKYGINCYGKYARQMSKSDYTYYDLLIGMDQKNLRNMKRICGGDEAGKIHSLMEYTEYPRDVADPWYTRDFDATWHDVTEGCQKLLKYLCSEML